MAQINRTGTFRFQLIDAGIKENKDKNSDVVQWVADLQAVEYYDEEKEQWIDWSEYKEQETTAYLTLFGKDGQEVFHARQLQQALGWSGADFQELEIEHIRDVVFQGRVDQESYQGTERFKVVSIAPYDAEPGRILPKLDSDGYKRLNAKHAAKLKKLSGGNKPKSVDKVDKADKVDKEAVKAAAKEKMADRAARGKAAEAKAAKIEGKQPPKPPELPKPPKPPTKQAKEKERCDKGQAWIDCCAAKKEYEGSMSDEQLETLWYATVDSLGGEDTIEEKELWGEVRAKVLKSMGR